MLKGTSYSKSTSTPESAAAPHDGCSAFLHFITADGREFGFPFSQLLHFVIEPAPVPTSGSAAPTQRLLLAFPSHDVILTGWRLHLLCQALDMQEGFRIAAEDPRFANLTRERAFVSEVTIALA